MRTKKFAASTAITFFTSLTVPKRSTPIRCAKLPKKNFTPAAAISETPPHKAVSDGTDGKNKFSVKNYYNGTWKRNVPAADCIFLSEDNPLKEIHDAVVSEASVRKAQTEAYDREEKYEYARKCGGLGRKLGIAYVNVMRLGPEKGKLMKFKESYERAIAKAKNMKLSELRGFYADLFRRGRASRKQAMDTLGIQYFEADVNLLVLTELEQAMSERLDAYVAESVKQAKNNAANADYPTRQRMYDDLMGQQPATEKRRPDRVRR